VLNLKKVAVTGALSSGKTTVTKILKELGATVLFSDEVVHALLSPATDTGKEVIKLLGPSIVENHAIDRSRVARRVFNNPPLLRKLEEILHPEVLKEIEKQSKSAEGSGKVKLFVVELPLLYEIGEKALRLFDKTIAVIADKELSWKRFCEQTGYEREEFGKRMARQISPEEKAKKADYSIYNNGSIADLKEQVNKIFFALLCV
jgi:dephospho-CoA kinase